MGGKSVYKPTLGLVWITSLIITRNIYLRLDGYASQQNPSYSMIFEMKNCDLGAPKITLFFCCEKAQGKMQLGSF